MSQDMMGSWFGLGRTSTGNLSRAGSGLRSISGEKMFDLLHRDVSHDPFGILTHQTSGGFLELDPFDSACLSRNISSSPRSSALPRNAKDLRQYELDFVKSGRLPDDLNGPFSRSSSDSLPPLSSISRDISMVSRDVSLARLLSRGTSPGLIHHLSGASESFPPLSPIRTPRKLYPPPMPPTPRSSHNGNSNSNNNNNNNHHLGNGLMPSPVKGKQINNNRARRPDPPLAPRELALDDQALQAEIDKLKAELAAVEQEGASPPAPPIPLQRSPGLFSLNAKDLPPPRIIHQHGPLRPLLLSDHLPPAAAAATAAAVAAAVATDPGLPLGLERRSESRKLLTQLKQLQEPCQGPEVPPKPPSVHPPLPPVHKEPDLTGLVDLQAPLSGSEDNKETPDDSKVTVGIYTRAERRAKIERFKEKKNRRNFDKKILYACRKSFADSRPRIGGRFVARQDKRPAASAAYNTGPLNDALLQNLLALLPLQGQRSGATDSQHVEDTQALFQQLMLCLPPQDDQGDSSPPPSDPANNNNNNNNTSCFNNPSSSSTSSFPAFSNSNDSNNNSNNNNNDNTVVPECSPALAGPAPSWPGFVDTFPPLPSRSISAP